MEAVFLKLLNMSISAGFLILAVILVRVVLKRAPKWIRCVLWGLVAVRLICPFSLESALSLIPSAETIPQEILYAREPVIHTGMSFVNTAVNPVISESLAPGVGDSVNPVQVLTFVASVVWLLGMAVMAVYALISYLRLRRKVAVSIAAAEEIYICDYIDTPFILGLVRPRIYLPSTLEKEQIPYVIAHERAHLKRRDHFWKPLGYVLLTVYWFHPLVWVAYVLLCRDIEFACDEKVIRELGEAEKKSYSDALLECSVPRKMIVACPLAFGEVGVKERVKTVLNYKRPAFWIMIVSVVACFAIAVCFLTNPKDDVTEPFGKIYRLEETTYVYGKQLISSVAYPIDYARYLLTEELNLMCKEGITLSMEGDDWVLLGKMQEVKLTEENFDACFREWEGLSGMPMDFSPKEYRKANEKAWQLLVTPKEEMSYYLLRQKNGDMYLVCWYYDSEREDAPESDDSQVRWMFKLTEAKDKEVAEPVASRDTSGLEELRAEQMKLPEPSENVGGNEDSETAEAEETSESSDVLEEAIHAAILGEDAQKAVEGLRFPCESNVILGTETLCAVPKADGTGGGEYLTVYAMVLEQDYVFGEPHGEIIDDGGSHMPVAITFKVEGDEYILEEYWRPQDGSYYESSIREKFPDDIEEEAMDTQKYILAQMQDCYNQAVAFAGTDVEAVIEELMEVILSSPKSASSVQDCISAHYFEYRELTYYGMHTLIYCRDRFEEGNQSGLKGSLMAAVSQDIAEGYGWAERYGDTYDNAQKWYDNYAKEGIFFPLGLAEENPRKDWGITLSADNVTADSLELTITQSGGFPTGTLRYGSEYKLMVWKDDVWKMVPTVIDNYAWKMVAYLIPMGESVSSVVDWTWLHGTLPAGKYRLIKEIHDFRGTADYDVEQYYVDFEIE